uniref:Uncharacterized protein n=1 Tax=Rhinolophus ferrumequinum TaxID=59479 RepID=A0A671FG20_RHIFE
MKLWVLEYFEKVLALFSLRIVLPLEVKGEITHLNQYQIKESTSVICWIISTKNSHSHTINCDSCKVIRFIVDFGQANSKMGVLIVCLLRKHK